VTLDPTDAAGLLLCVSPHFDDAVLSVGGLLAERASKGLPSLVLTVFGGQAPLPVSDAARAFHRSCGVEEDDGLVPLRRQEDARAVARLGASGRHLDLPEALYRRDRSDGPLYPVPGSQFGPRHSGDAALLEGLVDQLAQVIAAEGPQLVMGPRGTGGHVDHVLVRDALLRGTPSDLPVLLWTDQPYAVLAAPPGPFSSTGPVVGTAARLAAVDAAAEYRTQVPMLFGLGEGWRSVLVEVVGGSWSRAR